MLVGQHYSIVIYLLCFRHCRATRLVENLFGILANRWRVFYNAIALSPDFVADLALASLTLHNILRSGPSRQIYCPRGLLDEEDPTTGEFIPGSWRHDKSTHSMDPLIIPPSGHNFTTDAKHVRDTYKDYFVNEGAVSWQWEKCM